MVRKNSLRLQSAGKVSHVIWQPVLLALVLLTITVALWQGFRTQENRVIGEAVSLELVSGRDALVTQANSYIATAHRKAERWKEWDYNEPHYGDQGSGLLAMGWVDATNRTRYMVPSSAKDVVGDLGLMLTENQPELVETAKQTQTPQFSKIITSKQGGKLVFLVTPLVGEDQSSGILVDAFDINLVFGAVLKASVDEGWIYHLWDGHQEIRIASVKTTPAAEKWSQAISFQISGMTLKLEVMPGPAVLEKLSNRLSTILLIAGLVLSAVLTWGAWSAQTVRIKSDELREATGLLRQFREAMDSSAIVSMADVHGTITYVNDNFCKASHYSREELLGKNHRIIKSGFHPQDYYGHIRETILQGMVWQGEIRNRAKDGSHYWVYATIFPFLGVDGNAESFMGICNDITDRKNLEENLQRSNRALEEFSHIVAHELKSPLTVVKMAADNLIHSLLGPLNKAQEDVVRMIDKTMNQMATTISSLLYLAQLGTAEQKLVLADVDVKYHVDDVLQKLQVVAKEKNIVIRDEVPEDFPHIWSSAGLLMEILTNLIGNAIRYAAHEVVVEAQVMSGKVQFCVRDDGPGIPKDKLAELFGKFVSDNQAQSTLFKGTGLGLYICKDLVTHLGGKIWVESEEGSGARFCFTLPVDEPAEEMT